MFLLCLYCASFCYACIVFWNCAPFFKPILHFCLIIIWSIHYFRNMYYWRQWNSQISLLDFISFMLHCSKFSFPGFILLRGTAAVALLDFVFLGTINLARTMSKVSLLNVIFSADALSTYFWLFQHLSSTNTCKYMNVGLRCILLITWSAYVDSWKSNCKLYVTPPKNIFYICVFCNFQIK